VGASGSGKSTIAGAVAGVREADAGTVTVGGLEVSALEGAERARVVALVAQEGFVFPGTVRSNLDLVSPGAGEAVLWSALGLVGLADWARGLPEQLDTELGPAGLEVSSVRAQQLALARVAVLDPLVIVLDEAASEASPQDAGVLDEAVDGVRRGRTTVMVAHRLDGRVRGRGGRGRRGFGRGRPGRLSSGVVTDSTSAVPGAAASEPADDTPEQLRIRRDKRQRLLDSGGQAYPVDVPRTHSLAE